MTFELMGDFFELRRKRTSYVGVRRPLKDKLRDLNDKEINIHIMRRHRVFEGSWHVRRGTNGHERMWFKDWNWKPS